MYRQIQMKFEQAAKAEEAIQMKAYMRDQFEFYGLKAQERREIYREELKQVKKSGQIDWRLLNQCWLDPHREFQYFVVDYLKKMQSRLIFQDVHYIWYYLKTKQWWDTIDGLDRIVGNIGLRDDNINELMLTWSLDDDFWIRRAAINHQIGRKELTNSNLLKSIILNNLGSQEFFINKAIGWSLREYSKTNPEWVTDFVEEYRQELDQLSLKEASKYI